MRHQILAPLLLIVSGNSLVFSWKIQKNSRRLWRSRRRKSSSVPEGMANFPAAILLAGKCPNLGRDGILCCRKRRSFQQRRNLPESFSSSEFRTATAFSSFLKNDYRHWLFPGCSLLWQSPMRKSSSVPKCREAERNFPGSLELLWKAYFSGPEFGSATASLLQDPIRQKSI